MCCLLYDHFTGFWLLIIETQTVTKQSYILLTLTKLLTTNLAFKTLWYGMDYGNCFGRKTFCKHGK